MLRKKYVKNIGQKFVICLSVLSQNHLCQRESIVQAEKNLKTRGEHLAKGSYRFGHALAVIPATLRLGINKEYCYRIIKRRIGIMGCMFLT